MSRSNPRLLLKKRKTIQVVVLLILAFGLGRCTAQLSPAAGPAPTAEAFQDISGFWQDETDPEYFIGLEEDHWTVGSRGQVQSVSRLLSREGSQINLCQGGWRKVWEVRFESGGLLIARDPRTAETHRLRRIGSKPLSLSPSPIPLPEPAPLAAAKVAEIQRQLWERAQAGREAPQVPPEASQISLPWRSAQGEPQPATPSVADLKRMAEWAESVAYLKNVIAEVGWIDVERFGYAASNAAFFIAHHSSDLPLMMAALPGVERDARAGRTEGEDYALLFDRVQLLLGQKQRYGTQIGFDAANRAFVLSIEQPDQVDELRKSLDMMPLADYVRTVAHFNQAFAPPEPIFSGDCAD